MNISFFPSTPPKKTNKHEMNNSIPHLTFNERRPWYYFLKCRNDLQKVLDESDDALSEVETTRRTTKKTTTTSTTTPPPPTTKSTTAVSTTKSTTTQRSTKRYYAPSKSPPDDVPKTPKTYFSNSFSHNNNQNNINGQTDRLKSPKALVDTATPTPAPAKQTINPFYYGFNRLYNSTSTQKSARRWQLTTTARTPYSFQFYTTTKPSLLAPTQSINEVDNNVNDYPKKRNVVTEKPKPATYNPVFDIYFKQIGRQRTTTTIRP